VMKCLEKDPRSRYGSAEAMAQDLRRFVRGDPVEARPLSPWEKLGRRARKHRWLVAGAACILLLALTGGLLVRSQLRESAEAREKTYAETVLEGVRLLQYGRVKAPGRIEPFARSRETSAEAPRPGVAYALGVDPGESRASPAREAAMLLEEASRLLPDKPDARFHLSRCLWLEGRTEEARRMLSPLVDEGSSFLPARLWSAAVVEKKPKEDMAALLTSFRGGGRGRKARWEEPYIRAAEAEAARDWSAAVEAYTVLIDRLLASGDPYLGASLEARLGRGNAWLRLDRFDGALEDFGAAQALAPGAIEPYLLIAKTYYLKGDPASAEARLEGLFDSTALRDEAARRIAGVHAAFSRDDLALAWSERIEDEGFREMGRASALLRLLRYDEALDAALRARALRPGDPWAHQGLGWVHYRREEREDALASFEQALTIDPAQSSFLVSRASALVGLVREDEAIGDLRRAVEIDPANDQARATLAFLLRKRDELDEAEAQVREAIALDPRSAAARNALALILDSRGRLDEASAEYLEAMRLDPLSPSPHVNLGWIHCRRKRYDDAIAECRRSLELARGISEPRKILGAIFLAQGKLPEAEAEYREFVRLEPRVGLGPYNLGVVLEMQGRTEEAAAAYREACRLEAKDWRFPYNLGNTLRDLGRPEEAIEAYRAAIAANPTHGWPLYNIAEVELRLGRTGDAREHFDLATRHDPESPDAWWGLAALLDGEGKQGDSDAALTKGNALSTDGPRTLDRIRTEMKLPAPR